MNKRKNKSQVRKGRSAFFWLFVTLLVIVVIPVMLFTTYQISLSRDIVFAERTNYLRTIAADLTGGLDISIEECAGEIARLAENSRIRQYLGDENRSLQDLKVLSLLQDINKVINYDSLYMMDPQGVCVSSTNPPFVGNNYGFRPYFISAKDGNPGFYMAVGVTSNMPGFYFSAPVYHQSKLVGVMVGKCRIDDVARNFNELSASSSMKIMLVTEEGIIIATNEPSMMLNSIGALPSDTVERLKQSRQFAERAIPSVGYDKLWEKINSSNEQQELEFADTKSGRNNIAVFKQLKGLQWRVIVAQDQEVLLMRVRSQVAMLVIVGIASCLVAAIGSYCTSEIISKTIRNVSKVTSRISTGDYDIRLPPKGPTELRDMCLDFNNMVDLLVNSHKQSQRDAAELLEKNKMLAISEKRQKLIFESLPIGMVMINANKQIVEANTEALKLIRQRKEDIIGKKCDAVFCAADEDQRPVFNMGENVDLSERVALRRDGKQIRVLKSVVKVDVDGEPMLLEAFVDISDRKKAEGDLDEVLASVE